MRIPALLPLLLLAACGGLSATSEDVLFPNDGNATGDDDDDDDDDNVLGDDDDDVKPTDGDADTDADADADTDADTDTDTDVDTADTGTPQTTTPVQCPNPPNVVLPTNPNYIVGYTEVDNYEISMRVFSDGGPTEDFTALNNSTGATTDLSGDITVDYFIGNTRHCSVVWDFTEVATHVTNAGWSAGMFETWDVDLTRNLAWTDCNQLVSGNYWYDPVDLARAAFIDLEVALGPPDAATMSAYQSIYTGSFTTEVEPYAIGFYINVDGAATATPMGLAYGFEADCYEVEVDNSGYLVEQQLAATSGPLYGYYSAFPLYYYNMP